MAKNSEDLLSTILKRIEEIGSQLEVIQEYQQDPNLFGNQKDSLLSELNLYRNYVRTLLKRKVQDLSDDEVDKYFGIVTSELTSEITSASDRLTKEETSMDSQLSMATQSIEQIEELLKWDNWPIEEITSNRLIQTIIENSVNTYSNRYFINEWDHKGIITIIFKINPIYMHKLLNNDSDLLEFLRNLKKVSGDNLSIEEIESALSKKFGYKIAKNISVYSELCSRNTYATDYPNYPLFEENMNKARELNAMSYDGISYCERLTLKERLSTLKEQKKKLEKQISETKRANSTYLNGLNVKLSELSNLDIQAKKDYLLDRYCKKVSEQEYLDDVILMSRIRHLGFVSDKFDDSSNKHWGKRTLETVKEFREDLQKKKFNLDKLKSFDVESFIGQTLNSNGQSLRTALELFDQQSSLEKTQVAQIEDISAQIAGIEEDQKVDSQPHLYEPNYSFPHISFIEDFKRKGSIKKYDKWLKRKKERNKKINELQNLKSSISSMCDATSRRKGRYSDFTKFQVFNYFETNYGVTFSDNERKKISFSLESEEKLKESITNFLNTNVKGKLETPNLSLLSKDATSLVSINNSNISIDDAIKMACKLENQLTRMDLNLVKVSADVLKFAERIYRSCLTVPQDKVVEVLAYAAKAESDEIISNQGHSGPKR